MKTKVSRLLVLALAVTGIVWAADEDEPGRPVARISLMNGDVSVHRGDSGDWVAAAVNAPLVVDDAISTGANSRAEVQFDWANMVRLAANTEVRLAELENNRYMVQVARGLVTFRVLRDSDSDVEISTPNVSLRPVGEGSFRILVREDGESEITVRSGQADIYTPQGSERLGSGRTLLARGTAADPEYKVMSAIQRDEWDRWNDSRDNSLASSKSYDYVDRSVYGAEDLDNYGRWVNVPPYGWVWSPTGVAADWAPYSYGQWSWLDYYGWNWVSYDPWGWAPYHYGRWFYDSPFGWCWFPGALHTRQYWRPGLVAFFGFGNWSGFGVGFGLGHVGWVPLAPYETYRPWYGRGYYGGYRNTTIIDNSVHIVNNTNIVNVYRNARVKNAVHGVDASQFGRGNANMVRLSAENLQRVDLVNGRMPIAPTRESLRVSNREINATQIPRVSANEKFVSRRQPAKVDRVPFDQQQKALEQVARRTSGTPVVTRRGTDAPAASTTTNIPRTGQGSPATRTAVAPEAGGVRRTGDTPRTAVQNGEGWRRLGGQAGNTEAAGANAARQTEQPRMPAAAAPSVRSAPAETAAPRNSENGWRRFEGPSAPPATRPAEQSRPSTSPAPSVRNVPQENAVPRNQDNTWRRFEGPGAAPSAPQGNVRTEPRDTPRYQAPPAQRNDGGGQIRIDPPIVRQRESAPPPPRISEPPRQSAPPPRMSEPPRQAAPQVQEAPRSSGSFGSPRAESNGGGSSRSSDGGSSRSRSR